MSVINQMLKDLDSNQKAQDKNQVQRQVSHSSWSTSKILTLSIIAIVIINLIGLYGWSLYQENQALKANQVQGHQVNSKLRSEESGAGQLSSLKQDVDKNNEKVEQELADLAKPLSPKPTATQAPPTEEIVSKTASEQHQSDPTIDTDKNAVPIDSITTDLEKVEKTRMAKSSLENSDNKKADSPDIQQVQKAKPTLSIARKQLTPEQLVQTKLNKAQEAVNTNQLAQAQTLLEEVLLIDANQTQARKQLAALWFGKQDYQAAINLLSQGLALSPSNPELLVMKARIYLKQEQFSGALNTLLPYADIETVEYQSLLATSAQQTQRFDVAIKAYQQLTKLQPNLAKWWLGLASMLDSQSSFEEAVVAYRQAIAVGGLSSNSTSFVNQRLQALGGI